MLQMQLRNMLEENLACMRPGEADVARRLLRDLGRVASQSLREVAAWCGTSDATVVRACRAAGFDGFQDLKYRALRELTDRKDPASVRSGESARDNFSDDIQASIGASAKSISTAAEIIFRSERIAIAGVGASLGVGMILTDVLFAMKRQALPIDDEQALHFVLTAPRDGLALISISHSGETRFPIEAVRQARMAKVPTIGITNEQGSELARSVDVLLPTQIVERPEGSFSIAPRICQLAVLQQLIQKVNSSPPRSGRAGRPRQPAK